MQRQDNQLETVKKYFFNRISKDDYKSLLEQQRKGEISEEMIIEILKAKKDADLKAKWKEKLKQQEIFNKKIFTLRPYLAIAATLLLFLTAYFLLSPSTPITPKSPQALAVQYWKEATHPNQFNFYEQTRKEISDIPKQEKQEKENLDNAHDSYKKEEYKSVSNILQLIPPESQHYSEALILSGVAYFKLKENKKAINQFKKILNNRDISGNDEARKFLALIYLQTNQLEKAKKTLKEIIKAEDRFAKEAKELLEKLE